MSDVNDERPSKRRRRHSRSPLSAEDIGRQKTFIDRRNQNKPPNIGERGRWRQPRDHKNDTERHTRRRSSSGIGKSDTETRASRKYRDRSEERDTYQSSRPHRRRERSRTPESDRYIDDSKEKGRDRDRRKDQKPHRDTSRDNERSRERRRDPDRDKDRTKDRDRDRDRRRRSASPKPYQRSKRPLPSQNDAFTAESNPNTALDKPIEKQKPNFGLTGKLAAASNTVQTANQSIILKYHEPPEARKPLARDQWRLYIFKDDEILDTVELAEQSCWLFGREVAVADIPIEHSSCSKQHAAIQFRYIEKRNEFGDKIGKVKPYIIDLESANGTTVNEDAVPAAKYMELIDKDVIRFGHSTREYVIQLPPSK